MGDQNEMDVANFCRSIPKLELHAHLNGSLSENTLRKLYELQNPHSARESMITFNLKNFTTLEECFEIFDIAHSLTTTPEAVYVATCDVIKEFAEDNVIYLELRSTPRSVNGSMTKRDYIDAMINAITNDGIVRIRRLNAYITINSGIMFIFLEYALRSSKREVPNIMVKLLISVNRKQGYEAAAENIELAMEYREKHPECVVGIDLSGDPTQGEAFLELLEASRKANLKIAAHCAEISNEMEAMDILNFKPDRLGHCTCVHPDLNGSRKLFNALIESKIPVELCLTSNIKCKTVTSYASHHFKYLYDAKHPVCIATDDKGVFDTSLSNEMEILALTFDLTKRDLLELCRSAVHYSFANVEEKNKLLAAFDNYIRSNINM